MTPLIAHRLWWRGRRVLLTGHTGFKGAWAARWLTRLGAEVTGISLPPPSRPSLHDLVATPIRASIILDIRDGAGLAAAVAVCRPQVVLHLAAQALVPEGYRDPVGTFSSNVMGTINLLEAVRASKGVEAVLVATTDKVYANDESRQMFAEGDRLGGDDPYSASKAGTELAVHSYRKSFFQGGPPLATARAGNVIGGGDFAAKRLIPDIVRAASAGEPLSLRRPDATRPWQHVLDLINGYLIYAEALATGRSVPSALNFGPLDPSPLSVREITDAFVGDLGAPGWHHTPEPCILEKCNLVLDPSLAIASLRWRPQLDRHAMLAWTSAWYKAWAAGADVAALTDDQIESFEAME